MKTLATILALSTLSSLAAAGGPPSGHWHMNANKEYPGDLWLAPVADHLCAFYRYDGGAAKSGGMTLKVDGSTISGLYEEGIERGRITYKLDGKKLDGSYMAGESGSADSSPWVANFVPTSAVKLEKSYEIDWDEVAKTTITFKQSGAKVTGKVEYRYSGSNGGTITGTMYGNLLAGTYEEKNEDGSVTKGVVLLTFEKSLGSRVFDHVEGAYSVDLKECTNGGLFRGTTSR
jgi:hypothetical protein